MSANIIDQRTANLGLPLPNVNNMQDQDCGRIAESFRLLDAAHGKVRTDLAAVTEQSANAARDADTAIGKANDAASVAQSAATAADSALEAAQNAKGGGLYADVPIDKVPEEVLAGMAVGQFITVPEASGAGGSAGDADLSAYPTREEMKAYALKKTTGATVYIDPANADAADTLDEGRGDSPGKPFKNFIPAYNYAFSRYAGPVVLYVMSDCVVPDVINIDASRGRISIIGKSKDTKLTFENSFTVRESVHFTKITVELGQDQRIGVWGTDSFSGLTFNDDVSLILNNGYVFISGPGAYCWLGRTGINISGTSRDGYGVFMVRNGAALDLHDCTGIGGTVTGLRYSCMNHGRIILAGRSKEFIPGTIAGTCDESSTVA